MRFALALALAGALAAAATADGRGAAPGAPKGFLPEVAASAGARNIWVLGSYHVACGSVNPSLAFVRSQDGGRHFTRIFAPPLYPEGGADAVDFVGPRVGYAFETNPGPGLRMRPVPGSRLLVTRDGGINWTPGGPSGVTELAVGGRDVYVIVNGKRVERSPISRSSWHTLRLPASFRFVASLAAHGQSVWLLGSTSDDARTGDVTLRSADGGASFAESEAPCGAGLGGSLTPAGHGVVWSVCQIEDRAGLTVSTDGGRTFSALHAFGKRLPALAAGAGIFPVSEHVAVLYRGTTGPLLRTTDTGRRWRPARGTDLIQGGWLHFATSRVGVGLLTTADHPNRASLRRTTDGGATWHSVPIR